MAFLSKCSLVESESATVAGEWIIFKMIQFAKQGGPNFDITIHVSALTQRQDTSEMNVLLLDGSCLHAKAVTAAEDITI